jgi:energy-coupling factor transporter ATP-binding protein EcfA2
MDNNFTLQDSETILDFGLSEPDYSPLNPRVSWHNTETKSNSFSQWAVTTGNKFSPTTPTTESLPPGFYELGYESSIGIYLEKKVVNTDELFQLPSAELSDIIEDIEKFWQRSGVYKSYGFLHKRGILLYGDPGAGKSGIIQLCTRYLIEKMGGIVINISKEEQVEMYDKMLSSFRVIERDRPLIVIFEDIDAIAGESGYSTSMILNILDGVKQIDNVVYIATTNYPEKLEDRITNRPSRFDRRYEISMPDDDVRRSYIVNKLTEEDLRRIDLDKWVMETKGLSLAHMRELVVSVIAMGNSFEDTLNRLNGLKVKPKIKSRSKKIGFSS